MFDKFAPRHLQVHARTWRPLARDDPGHLRGIRAKRGQFIDNPINPIQGLASHKNKPSDLPQPPPPPEPQPAHQPEFRLQSESSPLTPQPNDMSHIEPASQPQCSHTPYQPPTMEPSDLSHDAAVHFTSSHGSKPHSSPSQPPSCAAHSVVSGQPDQGGFGMAHAAHLAAQQELHQTPNDLPSNYDLDAAVTEGMLLRTREDLEEQEIKLEEIRKAQELLALRESEVRKKEEALDKTLEAERLRSIEDAQVAQQLIDQARRDSIERAERETLARLQEEATRAAEEREKTMYATLEEEKRRLQEESRLQVEAEIREQKRKEEEARIAREIERLRQEDEARAMHEAQIQAAERAKEEAKLAARARIREREDLLLVRRPPRQRSISDHFPPPKPSPLFPSPKPSPLRGFHPISYAQIYSSPSLYDFSPPNSPVIPLSPFFVPDDVRKAAKAQQEYDAQRQKSLYSKTTQSQDTARSERQKHKKDGDHASQEHPQETATKPKETNEAGKATTDRGHLRKPQDPERRVKVRSKSEERREAEAQGARELEIQARFEAALTQREAEQRRIEEETIRREREALEKLKAEQSLNSVASEPATDQDRVSEKTEKRDYDHEQELLEAKKRGAEAAAFFMAKQALSKPFRMRKASISHDSDKPKVDHRRRVSYTETPPFAPSLPLDSAPTPSYNPLPPESGFMVYSMDDVPGYSHDVVKEIESSVIYKVEHSSPLGYLADNPSGKLRAIEGNRAALQALISMAEDLKADAIIKLRLQPPGLLDTTQVKFSAKGVAVQVKFLSPEGRISGRTFYSTSYKSSRTLDDVSNAVYHGTASAPVRHLQTPTLSVTSEPFGTGTPQASSQPSTYLNSPHHNSSGHVTSRSSSPKVKSTEKHRATQTRVYENLPDDALKIAVEPVSQHSLLRSIQALFSRNASSEVGASSNHYKETSGLPQNDLKANLTSRPVVSSPTKKVEMPRPPTFTMPSPKQNTAPVLELAVENTYPYKSTSLHSRRSSASPGRDSYLHRYDSAPQDNSTRSSPSAEATSHLYRATITSLPSSPVESTLPVKSDFMCREASPTRARGGFSRMIDAGSPRRRSRSRCSADKPAKELTSNMNVPRSPSTCRAPAPRDSTAEARRMSREKKRHSASQVPLPTMTPREAPLPAMTPREAPLPAMTPREAPLPAMTPREAPLPSMTPREAPLPSVTPREAPLPSMTPREAPLPPETPHEKLLPCPTPTEIPLPETPSSFYGLSCRYQSCAHSRDSSPIGTNGYRRSVSSRYSNYRASWDSQRFSDIWIGDEWEKNSSPAMNRLKTPLTPRLFVAEAQKKKEVEKKKSFG